MFRRGALTLFRVRSVPIRVHWSLLIAIPWLALVFSAQFVRLAEAIGVKASEVRLPPLFWGAAIAIGLFASVALHELAHTLVALRVGTRVHSITLMILGGVSHMERIPGKPRNEAITAAVGPLTSLALGGLLLLLLRVPLAPDVRLGVFFMGYLNVLLGVFNLLPAFPLDGGRVLRALLATRLGVGRSTQVAASIGRAGAIVLGLWAFATGQPLAVLIAAFLFLGAGAEARAQVLHDTLNRLSVGDLMSRRAATIAADASLEEAMATMRGAGRLDLVVVDADEHAVRPVRFTILRAADLAGIPAVQRPFVRIRDLGSRLRGRGITASPKESAAEAMDRATAAGADVLFVVDNGTLAGIVGRAEIDSAVALHSLDAPRHGTIPTTQR